MLSPAVREVERKGLGSGFGIQLKDEVINLVDTRTLFLGNVIVSIPNSTN